MQKKTTNFFNENKKNLKETQLDKDLKNLKRNSEDQQLADEIELRKQIRKVEDLKEETLDFDFCTLRTASTHRLSIQSEERILDSMKKVFELRYKEVDSDIELLEDVPSDNN